ncbi:MAG: amidoligase family protein [Archangium sp.]|nr:amidoligase family protein [Archangium sp.]
MRFPVGLELELLAPAGKTRFDLARALAKQAGGALRLSFKYHGQGVLPDGRPDCHLTPAARVLVRGKWFASVVDDPTIVDDLARTPEFMRAARTDDVRLAAWIERSCPGHFRPLQKTFAATEDEAGFVDPWGQPLVRWHHVSAERARVCEVVLRPLGQKELAPTLRRVMKLATSLGFTVPAEAAVHAHFDAAPFRSTASLRRLVLAWSKERAVYLSRLKPNPRCRKLGPFPPDVVRVATEATDELPFETLAAGLLLAGLHRAVDLNLLGLVERFPKQPTIEVRCLPGSLDPEATLQALSDASAFLESVRELDAPDAVRRTIRHVQRARGQKDRVRGV